MSEPLQELMAGEVEISSAGFSCKILSNPFDKFPVVVIEEFLFSDSLFCKFFEIGKGCFIFAPTRMTDEKVNP